MISIIDAAGRLQLLPCPRHACEMRLGMARCRPGGYCDDKINDAQEASCSITAWPCVSTASPDFADFNARARDVFADVVMSATGPASLRRF